MGNPRSKKASYRDDPDAVSLHTTPGDTQYTDTDDVPILAVETADSPPSYNDTAFYTDPDDGKFEYNGLSSSLNHFDTIATSPKTLLQKKRRMRIAGEHVSITQPLEIDNPEDLQEWIEYMSRQAPTPYIVVIGTHSERRRDKDGKSKQVEVTDFRVSLSLRNYLWPNFRVNDPTMMELQTVDNGDKTYRGTVLKKRAPGAKGDIEVGEAKPTLREWCHRYCASSSRTRMFRLTRTVVGINKEAIQDHLTNTVRSTNYRGHVNVEFPVADRAVDIYSDSLLNKWRLTTWIRWLFYLTFLWIFAWPILFFSTKRYHVVKARWTFSTTHDGNVKYTTVSEAQYLKKFGPAIAKLVRDRYQGVAGDDMMNEILASPEVHRPIPAEFPVQSVLGLAAGAISGGRNAGSQVSNILRFAGGSNDNVGWGFDT